MKIAISFPPLESPKGVPLLSQNRQFQWFSRPTYIYPMIPASAATLLRERGHEVFWDDGIAEQMTYRAWLDRIERRAPDLVVMETKTPVVKRHWKIAGELKERLEARVVLVGDHVTAMPAESLERSPVDFVITGGDFDFALADLCEHLEGAGITGPGAAPGLPRGIWYRTEAGPAHSGPPDLSHDLDILPMIDRDLTRWQLYAYKNGNFKYRPGTYVMAGRDCWWGRCSFCSWTTLFPGETYRTVSVERHLDEIGRLIADLGVREVFDDSGCFPRGSWLESFCEGMIRHGYNRKVVLGCNMRCGELGRDQWKLMKTAGFRFVLIGLESVVQSTLDRLNKGIRVAQIEETIRWAKEARLEPHVTTMVGYPWETREDAEKTIAFAKRMFTGGYLDSLQATIVVPYPGTPMFEEAKRNGWLLTEDWDRYDMKESVWKSPVDEEDVLRLTQGLYRAALAPRFILRKLVSVRNMDDLRYLAGAGARVLAHITDFRSRGSRDR